MSSVDTRREFLFKTASGAVVLASPAIVCGSARAASDYPSQDLTWLVHNSPGGVIDNTTRVLQTSLEKYGFKSSIDYARGASGRIARAKLYRAKPDGYTIMTDTIPDGAIGEVIYHGQYRISEFEPIIGWYSNSFGLIVQPKSPLQTLGDFVKAARSGRVTVATFGKGSAAHLQMALLRNKYKLNIQFVHFDGGARAVAAVLGGHVQSGIVGTTLAAGDTLKALAVFRDKRDPLLPKTATSAEQGYPVLSMNQIVYADAGPRVPSDRLAKLRGAFAKALADPAQIAQQKKVNVEVVPITSEELKKLSNTALDVVNEYKKELAE